MMQHTHKWNDDKKYRHVYKSVRRKQLKYRNKKTFGSNEPARRPFRFPRLLSRRRFYAAGELN